MTRMALATLVLLLAAALSLDAGAAYAEELLSAGHKLRAPQFCLRHRGHKGEGVTIYIRSVSEGGTRAVVGVNVACWGDAACTTQNCDQHTLKGSLTIAGESVALEFRDAGNPQRGVLEPLRGRIELREGKPALVFGRSAMQFNGGPIETPELVFQ